MFLPRNAEAVGMMQVFREGIPAAGAGDGVERILSCPGNSGIKTGLYL
jgi:hypothetical protein